MSLSRLQRFQYFAWAAGTLWTGRNRCCPACNGTDTSLIKRKYLVTSLWHCASCDLRFRVPKDDPARSADFYQEEYTQGFTTDCPSEAVLASLIATKFADAEKDFRSYVEVLRAAGLRSGDAILDFGCSWGYGSWQLREAGFNVYSYEISKPRALYAKDKLSCNIVESVEGLRGRLKCVFSAHVIEHLADPNLLWDVGTSTLEDGGLIVCFCPNGDPLLEGTYGALRYHQLWGKVHPLLVTSNFLQKSSKKHGYRARVYGSPYKLAAVAANGADDNSHGCELCLIAAKI